jgi:hypothetical protein
MAATACTALTTEDEEKAIMSKTSLLAAVPDGGGRALWISPLSFAALSIGLTRRSGTIAAAPR